MTKPKPIQPIPAVVADKLPQEVLAAIGEIVVRWGRLEWQLGNLLGVGLMLKKPAARTLIIGMDLSVICSTLGTLTLDDQWIKRKKLRDEIAQLAKDVRANSKHRNDYAHGVFGFDMDRPNEFARYLFKSPANRINPSFEPLDLNNLRQMALDARSFVDRAVDLTVQLVASRRK